LVGWSIVFLATWQGGDSSLLDSSHTDLEEEEDEESLLRERELTDKYLGKTFYFSSYVVSVSAKLVPA
jgi:hypothetical protein